MIVIPIKSDAGDTDSESCSMKEWSLIELNGELIPPKTPMSSSELSTSSTLLNLDPSDSIKVELGSLYFDPKGTPTMIIGSHELKGSVQKLSNPLVLLRPDPDRLCKKRRTCLENESNKDIPSQDDAKGYIVAGVITQKILFNNSYRLLMGISQTHLAKKT